MLAAASAALPLSSAFADTEKPKVALVMKSLANEFFLTMEWLERWLDDQIKFDGVWEKKVVDRILHNMSLLFERTFDTVQELNRYRKEVVARLAALTPAPAA